MRADRDGRPLCGDTGARLGVRVPRDIEPDAAGMVSPGVGGLSITPDDPRHLPPEFRPESLGGLGRLPLFALAVHDLTADLQVRLDPTNPQRHGFLEPTLPTELEAYQRALCATAPHWRVTP